MTGSLYICPEHPELGTLSDALWTRHVADSRHPSEMRVRSLHPHDGRWGWTQHVRVAGPAPASWGNLMRSVVGR
jgi:hypothetical protein